MPNLKKKTQNKTQQQQKTPNLNKNNKNTPQPTRLTLGIQYIPPQLISVLKRVAYGLNYVSLKYRIGM